MEANKYEKVRFRNAVLICPIINGEPHVLIKNIIDDIGLNYSSAQQALRKHPRLSNYCAEWHSRLDKIQGYKYLTMPIMRVSAWLYSIDTSKVKPAARVILEEYQDKCDYVLYEHFFGAKGELRERITQASQYDKRIRKAKRLITVLNKEVTRLTRLKREEDERIFKAANPEIDFGSRVA